MEIPSSVNVTIGEQAVFYCNHSTTQDIAWRVNETSLSVLNLPTITTRRIRPQDSVGFVHELTIQALAEYNQTSVQCLAYVSESPAEFSMPRAEILIQGEALKFILIFTNLSSVIKSGILTPVSNIKRNGSTITWDTPFSLDLTGIDPDIVYCVEVYNITCGEINPVFMDCNVLDNIVTCSCEPQFIYEVLVSPRSNVDQAMNGTVLAIKGIYRYLYFVYACMCINKK